MPADLPPLIRSLLAPDCYGHPAGPIGLIETHISWVILTGAVAYKIKKPVNLGFLDFSTLEKRRFYCAEELRLNRRLAPALYLDVAPVTGDAAHPRMGGEGQAIEYAVRMAQFPTGNRLDHVLARGELLPGHVDLLARELAGFHGRIAVADAGSPHGDPDHVWQPVAENFEQIRARRASPDAALARLEAWSRAAFARLKDDIAARKRAGFVRECHGDAHLANMVLMAGEIVLFDGIEFNENLRWIDVVSEVAFAVMDLDDRGRPDLGRRLLNAWLEYSGDFAGLRLLRFYQVYRALVRAKVAAIRGAQEGVAGEALMRADEDYRSYVALAERYTRSAARFLLITHGVSGCGKTFVTQRIIEALDVARVRSDVERKRLFGLAPAARSGAGIGAGIYTRDANARTYARLEEIADTILDASMACIVDATFLKRSGRERMRAIAARHGVPFVILAFDAPVEALRARVIAREEAGKDASEAGIAVLERQLTAIEPLTDDERAGAIVVDSTTSTAADAAITALRSR